MATPDATVICIHCGAEATPRSIGVVHTADRTPPRVMLQIDCPKCGPVQQPYRPPDTPPSS